MPCHLIDKRLRISATLHFVENVAARGPSNQLDSFGWDRQTETLDLASYDSGLLPQTLNGQHINIWARDYLLSGKIMMSLKIIRSV
jgi:hypothetical protein